MSDFSSIATAYQRYNATGSWADVNYGLIYTCNAGWVDLGHLNPNSSRPLIGATNLWHRVRAEGPVARTDTYCVQPGPAPFGGPAQRPGCEALPASGRFEFRFPGGQTGYEIRYRQDHAGYPGRPGAERRYLVRHNLTIAQKKSVALSIFMNVSHAFETFQMLMGLGGMITDSGYSQEDLVSNLIGFYIGVGDIRKEEAIRLAHPVSQGLAESIWNENGAVGSNKNFQFSPQILASYRIDNIRQMCTDECATQPKRLPDEFRRIRPAQYGQEYIELNRGNTLSFSE